ncbi:ribosomal protein S8.e [Lichtheimia ornata]|uniref:40S ribosomal protein S8 n=1 Tax=Lichtheimia ornata TaxID=688661 RepID=A0AAD7Y3E5_9FUNG|nr:ribosomal protein S8.e [Lichtheimia ornata]XP_058341576.1 ribosomal protein S8.e [Lichtheimia ornata]XP_058342844.1 ribosomal protein S8.e [Lichtheimia ornata]XP_058347982.1 ribosomal protein S8.e [Lichtheimia ornata]KAJ8655937.1 ribosomal protein S8.e [Lichtheimia ornata]KAJ8656663.1 ribosomal protein S8.e [Lichtheimia ornata]KAJ8657931.1 ribosomal protein S8.e [Lichtheimia ornata]KAJ8663070.1 ribosomal protein S8.e [Lichtheimia ornata]
MGISRSSLSKCSKTGAKRTPYRKKRKFELGRPAAMTKLGAKRVHTVRTRGGNSKFRALRLESGNYSWGSEGVTRKTRILTVVYNASNNELVRTNTLVKNAVVQIDATPFRQWYENHYALPLGKKKLATSKAEEVAAAVAQKSKSVQKKVAARQQNGAVDTLLDDQFAAGRLYAVISSRPGQCGRADGYILEGKELEFYLKKIKSRK